MDTERDRHSNATKTGFERCPNKKGLMQFGRKRAGCGVEKTESVVGVVKGVVQGVVKGVEKGDLKVW